MAPSRTPERTTERTPRPTFDGDQLRLIRHARATRRRRRAQRVLTRA